MTTTDEHQKRSPNEATENNTANDRFSKRLIASSTGSLSFVRSDPFLHLRLIDTGASLAFPCDTTFRGINPYNNKVLSFVDDFTASRRTAQENPILTITIFQT